MAYARDLGKACLDEVVFAATDLVGGRWWHLGLAAGAVRHIRHEATPLTKCGFVADPRGSWLLLPGAIFACVAGHSGD